MKNSIHCCCVTTAPWLTSLPQIHWWSLKFALCTGVPDSQQQKQEGSHAGSGHGKSPRSAAEGSAALAQPHAASSLPLRPKPAAQPPPSEPPLFRTSSRGERDWKALSRCCAWQLKRKNCLTPGNNRVRAGSGCCSSSSSCWYGRCSTLFHSALIAVFHQLKARQLSAGGSSWLSRLSCSGRQQQSFTPAGESERQRNRDEEKHK